MPKRIPTPPPGDDEPRYLTVVHPYAISGTCNMELLNDRLDFARWVACCVDKDAFFAIFHKPSSRGMVIIEINRDYAHFDRILGEHRWSEFLQSPTKEEMGRISQVFHCSYNTGRIVQKNGWKRIDVDEAWFRAWSPKNRQIKFPYPPTHFCDVPIEDQTNHALCRPLPGTVVSPPPVEITAPQPVVGSAAWIQKKEGGPCVGPVTTHTKPNTLGAWGKGVPKSQAVASRPNPATNASFKKTASTPQGPLASARAPAVGGGPIAVKSSNVWQTAGKKPVAAQVATHWDESPPISRRSTPALSDVPSVTTNQAPVAPPGLLARKNAWGSTTTYPTLPPALAVPGKTASSVAQSAPDMSWGSAGASTSSPDSDSGPDLTTATESDNPYAVHIYFSESMEEEFHRMRIRTMEDDGELQELDSIAPGNWDEPMAWEEATPARWDNDPLDAEDLWKQNQEIAPPVLCKAHGTICKKGICAEYALQLRNAKRAEEAEKRKAAGANKGKKGGRTKGRGTAAAKTKDENTSTDKNVAQNIHRGPGAPVKTNWRGAPRAIVSPDAMASREPIKAASDDGWGNSDSEGEPKAAAVVSTGRSDTASGASWGISENAHDPWATPTQPAKKATPAGGKPLNKKPGQTTVPSSWADQVETELAADEEDAFSVVSSKHGSKRGKSTTNWRSSATSSVAKSSTSGWGSVADKDMPW